VVFVETSAFTWRWDASFGDEELRQLQAYLLEHPGAGDVIPGGGGLRKLRWRAPGRGKRGGTRLIYYHAASLSQIYLLLIYAKNQQKDLTAEQIAMLKAIIEEPNE